MRTVLILTLLALFGTSCVSNTGLARLTSTSPDSMVSGTVLLTETPDGLRMVARVEHAPPGRHGFHIHENGSCADAGKGAGGHYNPTGASHGFLPEAGMHGAHAGDFGNITVDNDGIGTLELTLPGLSVSGGRYPVAGKAVILHADTDDLTTQPTGNAGARIACGVILVGQ